MPDRDRPLVLVSNRGPVTFQEDGSVKRGTGGLVTALTGLASHRDAVWIASAMTDARREVAARARRRAVLDRGAARRRVPRALRGVRRRRLRRLLQRHRQPDAVVHPALPVGPEQRAGHPPRGGRGVRAGLLRRQRGPRAGRAAGDRGRRGARRHGPRLPLLHAAGDHPRASARTSSCTTSSTSRGRSRTPGACCRRASATRSSTGCWPTTSSASTRAPTGATSCSAAAT